MTLKVAVLNKGVSIKTRAFEIKELKLKLKCKFLFKDLIGRKIWNESVVITGALIRYRHF